MSELNNEIHLTDYPTNFNTNFKDILHDKDYLKSFFEENQISMNEIFSQNDDFSDKNNSNSYFTYPLFKVVNKKRGRCNKLCNKHAIHTKCSVDNSYKKIINNANKIFVSELNQLIEKNFGKDFPKLNLITGVEKGYVKSLLEKTIENILIDYKEVVKKTKKTKETKKNVDVIEKIKNVEEIKRILESKFYSYIDNKMKTKMEEISDKEEKKIWKTILDKGILEFCKSKKSKKKKLNK